MNAHAPSLSGNPVSPHALYDEFTGTNEGKPIGLCLPPDVYDSRLTHFANLEARLFYAGLPDEFFAQSTAH